MNQLPTTGPVSYNGVTWLGLYKSKVSAEPQYDESGRTVQWLTYRLEIEGPVTARGNVTGPTLLPPDGLVANTAAGGALVAGVTYWYTVTALNNLGESPGCSEVAITPNGGNLTVQLSWNAVAGATGYRVYRGLAAGAENLSLGVAMAPATGFIDNGVAGVAGAPPGGVGYPRVDPILADWRKLLMTPGGTLQYEHEGFGPFSICVPGGGVWDVAWGPKPRLLSFETRGDGTAAWVFWACEIRIPSCDSALYRSGIVAFNYEETTEFDEDGFTTVRRNGHIIIPLAKSAVGDRSVLASADTFREQIGAAFPPPFLFRRRPGPFKLSMDRTRLDWTLTDEEVVSPLPAGATQHNHDSDISM